jgi:hypothetical protein
MKFWILFNPRSLGATLNQIKTLTQTGVEEQIALDLIREGQFFIEWVVPLVVQKSLEKPLEREVVERGVIP